MILGSSVDHLFYRSHSPAWERSPQTLLRVSFQPTSVASIYCFNDFEFMADVHRRSGKNNVPTQERGNDKL